MTTSTDAVLRAGIEHRGEATRLTLAPAFQGLPDSAHGGSVLAAFLAVGGTPPPCEVRGLYRKRVPVGVPLRLTTSRRNGALVCRLFDDADAVLVEGHVGPPQDGAVDASLGHDRGDPLPVSPTCFVCGVDNALGLRARLAFDARTVGGTWRPRAGFAADDGALAPVVLTALLDEAAFWLGALATGESGMTTDLAVTLRRALPFGEPVTVSGARDAVRPLPDDPRYWVTEIVARDAGGAVVAEARITFVAVRGAAKRLAAGMLAINPPDVVRRVFPAYTR